MLFHREIIHSSGWRHAQCAKSASIRRKEEVQQQEPLTRCYGPIDTLTSVAPSFVLLVAIKQNHEAGRFGLVSPDPYR